MTCVVASVERAKSSSSAAMQPMRCMALRAIEQRRNISATDRATARQTASQALTAFVSGERERRDGRMTEGELHTPVSAVAAGVREHDGPGRQSAEASDASESEAKWKAMADGRDR